MVSDPRIRNYATTPLIPNNLVGSDTAMQIPLPNLPGGQMMIRIKNSPNAGTGLLRFVVGPLQVSGRGGVLSGSGSMPAGTSTMFLRAQTDGDSFYVNNLLVVTMGDWAKLQSRFGLDYFDGTLMPYVAGGGASRCSHSPLPAAPEYWGLAA
ncbi:MAG: hypothetical protein LKI34_02795 [Bifidobacterium tibiigranuli]|jgi:hypothetical protein|uniref:hypothetical protein n=1 Tax=Bifidobacterium tibiigranuli TaxID=2172043 RepID=UPI0026EDA376|nr:hypothetical protein [Bifidobacterium tibiigranuli]MCI1673134.1 hypothetical protein [Bifidobacterium tibiigranuli]MCI1713621.1 hypothetical protein [Bifidobacterium tibiigranuli]